MSTFIEVLRLAGAWLGWTGVWALCAGGLVLSAVGVSGTWLVVVATALAAWLSPQPFPTLGVVVAMACAAAVVEFAEWGAGHWGVRRRGGSRLAGFAAMAGGLLGALLGVFVPPPFLGSLVCMLAGSFGLAYLVERRRLQQSAPAAHIATGAVLACLAILMLKISVTLGMALSLLIGVLLTR